MRWAFGSIVFAGLVLGIGLIQVNQPRAFAQKTGGKGTLTASGVGIVKAPADTAKVTFAVEVSAAEMKSAQEEISTRTQKLLAGVKVLKLDGMTVKLAPLVVAELPARLDDQKGKVSYQLTQSFQVTLSSDDPETLLENANTVVGAAIANGANATSPFGGPIGAPGGLGGAMGNGSNTGPRVLFSVRNDGAKRREALEIAVADAVKNAKALAKGAGVSLGEMIAINDPPATASGHHAQNPFVDVSNYTDEFGEREITVKVTVVFGY